MRFCLLALSCMSLLSLWESDAHATGSAAGSAPLAGSFAVCEDGSDDAVNDDDDSDDVVDQVLVAPCAIAESGLFGPSCEDAPVYVLSSNGVLLCQVSVP